MFFVGDCKHEYIGVFFSIDSPTNILSFVSRKADNS
jgi:hypothetical protein